MTKRSHGWGSAGSLLVGLDDGRHPFSVGETVHFCTVSRLKTYIRSTMAAPNSEVLTSVASSMRRAKS